MKRTIVYNIEKTDAGNTVKEFLIKKDYSAQNLTDLKRAFNGILHNGARAYVTEKLSAGDQLIINIFEDSSSEKIPPVEMPLDIVYEDEDIMLINKSADMPTHPSMNNYENTMANGLAAYFEKQQEGFVFRSINRLDRNTTGLVLVAKHSVSAAMLSRQVREGSIYKEYVALASGNISSDAEELSVIEGVTAGNEKNEFSICAPIARLDGSTIERIVDFEQGERAVTHVKILDTYTAATLVSCQLETGRTHQIRVHMRYIGHPLLGDGLYNPEDKSMERQALHCRRMILKQPVTGEKIDIEIPMPKDMLKIMKPE